MTYLYFDQAASSFPKPKVVGESMLEAIEQYGANPGRGGHLLARRAGEVIYGARQKLAKLFGLDDANRVIFYQNATYALNQAIMGLQLQAGNHIITTVFEHNSVRRPLEYLRRTKGIEITYVIADENGRISAKNIEKAITPQTVAIVASHGSNVTGAILPLHEVGKIAYQNQVKFIVDAAQSAGLCSIDMEWDHIDALAFPGHKGLLGPQGTAALLIRHSLELMPITFGGTGSFSELIEQPEKLPERFEVGTLNTPGIAGLSAALDVINERGLDKIFAHHWELTKYCLEQLVAIDGVRVYGPPITYKRLPVISFTLPRIDANEAAIILDDHYQIGVRAGLHCAPLAHEALQTIQSGGALRASFGLYHTKEDVQRLIHAIKEILSFF